MDIINRACRMSGRWGFMGPNICPQIHQGAPSPWITKFVFLSIVPKNPHPPFIQHTLNKGLTFDANPAFTILSVSVNKEYNRFEYIYRRFGLELELTVTFTDEM